jgi:hypothetical protein
LAVVAPVTTDVSTLTRFFETHDVLQHFAQAPTALHYATGFGIGASYVTDWNRLLQEAGEREVQVRQHHVHLTYVAVLFRNGPLGLAVVLAIMVVGVRSVASKNPMGFVAGGGILGLGLDYLTTQSLYFSVELPMLLVLRDLAVRGLEDPPSATRGRGPDSYGIGS